MGRLDEALAHSEQALAIFEKTLGTEHQTTAISYSNLGALLFQMQDYGAAVTRLEQALAIKQKTVGPNHPDSTDIKAAIERARDAMI